MTDTLEHDAAARVCANCATPAIGDYCHACGQRIGVHRLTLPHFLHEIPHAIFHVDRGILVTLRALATRPGRMINDYLDGHRIRYFNPLSLLMLLAGICAYAYSNFPFDFSVQDGSIPRPFAEFNASMNKWIFVHYSLFAVTVLPIQALFSLWFFKGRRSYGEHLAIHAYLTAFNCAINIVSLPVFMMANGTAIYQPLLMLNALVMIGYNFIATWAVFSPHRSTVGGLVRSIATTCAPLLLGAIAMIVSFMVFLIRHPDIAKQMHQAAPH